ncbi:hypothetical protein E2C01_061547 [Portunus trituberculatus]|uniref:Uncharacterized protein n=1 Tax=Portunus trituberculatus TaxID=210409 RepID=A0A5B7H8F5_PORTR|nr:hypothetical protein [Portunus trituberculatus]
MHLWYTPASEDDVITLPQSLPPPSVAVSAWHVDGKSVQRKPAEFIGQVACEANLLKDKARLVASLQRPMLEILAHMTASQRSMYTTVAEALKRCFGSVFQSEVYRE